MGSLFNLVLAYFRDISFLVKYCPSTPLSSPLCRQFWLVIGGFIFAVIFIFLLQIFIKAVRRKRALAEYKKLLEERAVIADDETMDKYKWKSLDDTAALSESELAQKFRESLNQNLKEES